MEVYELNFEYWINFQSVESEWKSSSEHEKQSWAQMNTADSTP